MQPALFKDWRYRTVSLEQREIQPAAAVANDGQAETQPEDAGLLDTIIGRTRYSKSDKDLLRKTLCKDATQDQFDLFMRQCQRLQLDPFLKQAHLVVRKGQAALQVGVDGYRLLAARSREYAGNDAPLFEGEEKLAGGRTHPVKATVTVYRLVPGGGRLAFSASVLWSEFYPGDGAMGFMYREKPYLMLGKCAECQALRKAFPAETSGVVAEEDLEVSEDQQSPPMSKPLATLDQRKRLDKLRVSLGMDVAEMSGLISKQGFSFSSEMPTEAADELLRQLEGMLARRQSEQDQRQPGEEG
jgi:phage recombination protein Bet